MVLKENGKDFTEMSSWAVYVRCHVIVSLFASSDLRKSESEIDESRYSTTRKHRVTSYSMSIQETCKNIVEKIYGHLIGTAKLKTID